MATDKKQEEEIKPVGDESYRHSDEAIDPEEYYDAQVEVEVPEESDYRHRVEAIDPEEYTKPLGPGAEEIEARNEEAAEAQAEAVKTAEKSDGK